MEWLRILRYMQSDSSVRVPISSNETIIGLEICIKADNTVLAGDGDRARSSANVVYLWRYLSSTSFRQYRRALLHMLRSASEETDTYRPLYRWTLKRRDDLL